MFELKEIEMKIANLLIDKKADVNHAEEDGITLLHIAVLSDN